MTLPILGGNLAARKSFSTFIQRSLCADPGWTLPGLCPHPSVSPDAQVRILGAVKETGSAPLADLLAVLPEFTEPAAAVLGLVETGILHIAPGLIDGDSMLTLAASGTDAGEDSGNAGAAYPAEPSEEERASADGMPAGVRRASRPTSTNRRCLLPPATTAAVSARLLS
jgi:hypothetical protein